jgi:hypothetical protein
MIGRSAGLAAWAAWMGKPWVGWIVMAGIFGVGTSFGFAAEVTVSPLQGPSFRGTLVQLLPDELVVESSGESQSLPLDELRRVDFIRSDPSAETSGPIQVKLTDGSLLRGRSFRVADSQATLGQGEEEVWKIPTRSIAHVGFREYGDAALRDRFGELAGATYSQDTLIFRRESEGTVTLDTLQGVLYDVRDDGVDFLFDGERISPRRERVDGLVYFHPARTGSAPPTICLVRDQSGSQWQAAKLTWRNGGLELETVAGVRVDLPLEELQSLDFAAGNLVYLSELEPEQVVWRPFFESRVDSGLLERRYAPRRDQSFDGGPLRMLGESYEKGLSLRSHTTLVYRVGSDFRRFRARMGMDDLARNSAVTSSVLFTISGDDRVLWEGEVLATDSPLDLDLEITGVRRLKLTVDFGDDLDIADFLNLADARFTK